MTRQRTLLLLEMFSRIARSSQLVAMACAIGCGYPALAELGDGGEPLDSPIRLADAGDGPSGSNDGPSMLTGLGQLCVVAQNGADCPAQAHNCLPLSAAQDAKGMCTPFCVTNGTMTTDGSGNVSQVTPDPAGMAPAATCKGAFNGTVGTTGCALLVSYSPPDSPPHPNTSYSNVELACVIGCGAGNTCPGQLKCDSADTICKP